MRPRISIRACVRPSVRRSVGRSVGMWCFCKRCSKTFISPILSLPFNALGLLCLFNAIRTHLWPAGPCWKEAQEENEKDMRMSNIQNSHMWWCHPICYGGILPYEATVRKKMNTRSTKDETLSRQRQWVFFYHRWKLNLIFDLIGAPSPLLTSLRFVKTNIFPSSMFSQTMDTCLGTEGNLFVITFSMWIISLWQCDI